jgi:hypothetical protein
VILGVLSGVVGGSGIVVTLNALGLSSIAFSTGGTTSVGVTGRTAGSTITATSSDGTTLSVSGTTLTGTFTAGGSPTISLTETLAGATNTPRVTMVAVTVTAVALPPFLGSNTQTWGNNTNLIFGKAA